MSSTAEKTEFKPFHHAHHFDSPTTQFDAGRMGIWLFLVTEVLLFGGMFCAFAIFRSWYYDAFVEAHEQLNKILGSINTMVLILSSLTMALAVRASQQGKRSLATKLMVATLMCAATFLVIKYFEYHHKFEEHFLPGAGFCQGGKNAECMAKFTTGVKPGIFFAVYFMMTGIHGVHVIIGMCLISWVTWRNNRGDFSPGYYAPVEGVGLYWHLVDLIWIYLFPLLYLVGGKVKH
jgi:cytochrome c oxidase subunit 3